MPLILHPGVHKTGTSLLQRRVFPLFGDQYVGRHYDGARPFAMAHDLGACLSSLALGRDCAEELAGALVALADSDRTVLLSDERLLRPRGVGEFFRALELAAQRSPTLAISVVMTVRPQWDLVVSRHLHDIATKYREHRLQERNAWSRLLQGLGIVRATGIDASDEVSLLDALEPDRVPCAWPACMTVPGACSCREQGVYPVSLSMYDFHGLYEQLIERLPASRVLFVDVVTEARQHEGAERLLAFLDEQGMQSPVDGAALREGFRDRVNVRSAKDAGRVSPVRYHIADSEREVAQARVTELFAQGNARLGRVFEGLDLDA